LGTKRLKVQVKRSQEDSGETFFGAEQEQEIAHEEVENGEEERKEHLLMGDEGDETRVYEKTEQEEHSYLLSSDGKDENGGASGFTTTCSTRSCTPQIHQTAPAYIHPYYYNHLPSGYPQQQHPQQWHSQQQLLEQQMQFAQQLNAAATQAAAAAAASADVDINTTGVALQSSQHEKYSKVNERGTAHAAVSLNSSKKSFRSGTAQVTATFSAETSSSSCYSSSLSPSSTGTTSPVDGCSANNCKVTRA
jgi:hypothetical protein